MLNLTHMFFGSPAPLPKKARRVVDGKEVASEPKSVKRKDVASEPKPVKRKDVRVCITCKDEKPLSEFTKHGYQCKSCKPKPLVKGPGEKTIRAVLDEISYVEYETAYAIATRVGKTPQTVRQALEQLRKRKDVRRKVLKHGHYKFIRVAK